MKRISARHMYLAKWVLPPVLYLIVIAWMFVQEARKPAPHFWTLSIVLTVLAIIIAFQLKRRVWGHADEVLDGSDYLLIRFGARQQKVEFSNIVSVDVKPDLGATTVTLRLSVPCEFGTTISFLAASTSRNPLAANAIAEDLVARIRHEDRDRKAVFGE